MTGLPRYPLARHRIEKRWFESPLAVVAPLSGLFAFNAFAAGSPGIALVAFAISVGSLVGYYVARRAAPGTLILEPDGFRIDGGNRSRMYKRSDIDAGYRLGAGVVFVHFSDGRRMTLTLSGPQALVADRSGETAVDRVLAHLEVGLGQRAIVVPLRRFFGAFSFGLFAYVALLIPGCRYVASHQSTGGLSDFPGSWPTLVIGFVLPLVLAILFARRFGSPKLVIGNDGLRVIGGFSARHIPYRDIDEVRREDTSLIRVTVRGARSLLFAMHGQDDAIIAGVTERMRDVQRRARSIAQGGRSTSLGGTLLRSSRSIAEWRASLAHAAQAQGGFRDLALPADDVESVLHDARAPLEERVGAAFALRELRPNAQSESARARIRVAAEASANPDVRALLEAAAADEIDEIALEKLLDANARRSS